MGGPFEISLLDVRIEPIGVPGDRDLTVVGRDDGSDPIEEFQRIGVHLDPAGRIHMLGRLEVCPAAVG